MFSESHRSGRQYYKQKLKLKWVLGYRFWFYIVLNSWKTYCWKSGNAGILHSYTVAGIRQSSVKARKTNSKAYFELCRCTGAISMYLRHTIIAFRSHLSQKVNLTLHSQHLSISYVPISVLQNHVTVLFIIPLYYLGEKGNYVCTNYKKEGIATVWDILRAVNMFKLSFQTNKQGEILVALLLPACQRLTYFH